jgi:hypothetical protein
MPGLWFSTTAGRFLEYESLLERDWILLLDFDLEVEWICEQPLRLRYRKDGALVTHVPRSVGMAHRAVPPAAERDVQGWVAGLNRSQTAGVVDCGFLRCGGVGPMIVVA